MPSHHLKSYKNLIAWALDAYAEPTLTKPQRKDEFLAELNEQLGTNYQRQHIDNWLAGRTATPKRVREILIDELIEAEVQFVYCELGMELKRLLKT